MKRINQKWRFGAAFAASMMALTISGCAAPAAVAENKLDTLKIKPGPKQVVAISEFHSNVSGVSAASAVDMFTTALVRTNAFAVAKHAPLDDAAARDRKPRKPGKAREPAESKPIRPDYVVEATVSADNPGEAASSGKVSYKGLSVEGASALDSIGFDVRVINAQTGLVIDAINVRKEIKAASMDFSGLGSLLKSTGLSHGSDTPDAQVATAKKDGVERQLRECIEEAVFKLVQRLAVE
jgi:curli biogenesis system outer membrane secretion channel CsgG